MLVSNALSIGSDAMKLSFLACLPPSCGALLGSFTPLQVLFARHLELVPAVDVPSARRRNPKPNLNKLFGVGHRGVNEGKAGRWQIAIGLVRSAICEGAQVHEGGPVMLAGRQRKDLWIGGKLGVQTYPRQTH